MLDRSKLHAMLDELPEDKLRDAEQWMNSKLHPDPRHLAILEEHRRHMDAFMHRAQDRSGGLGIGAGSLRTGPNGIRNGAMSSTRTEGDTTVNHVLRVFQNHEIEIIERFTLEGSSHDLLIASEVTCNGKTLRNEMRFPSALPER